MSTGYKSGFGRRTKECGYPNHGVKLFCVTWGPTCVPQSSQRLTSGWKECVLLRESRESKCNSWMRPQFNSSLLVKSGPTDRSKSVSRIGVRPGDRSAYHAFRVAWIASWVVGTTDLVTTYRLQFWFGRGTEEGNSPLSPTEDPTTCPPFPSHRRHAFSVSH